jgi:GAF domain-containing protein
VTALPMELPGRRSRQALMTRPRSEPAALPSSFAPAPAAAGLGSDVANDPRYLINQESTGSELIVPVVVKGRVVGTLDVEDAAKDAFDEDDRALFEDLAEALTHLYT